MHLAGSKALNWEKMLVWWRFRCTTGGGRLTWCGVKGAEGEFSQFLKSSCVPVVPKLECLLGSPGQLIKLQSAGPIPRVADLVDVGWRPRICIFNKLPDAAAGWWTVLWVALTSLASRLCAPKTLGDSPSKNYSWCPESNQLSCREWVSIQPKEVKWPKRSWVVRMKILPVALLCNSFWPEPSRKGALGAEGTLSRTAFQGV